MKNYLLKVMLSGCILVACKTKQQSPVAEIPPGTTSVTIKNFQGLDGCGFLVSVNDTLRYEPIELADSLKRDGLQLWIRFKPVTSHMSICMAGTAIRISEAYYR